MIELYEATLAGITNVNARIRVEVHHTAIAETDRPFLATHRLHGARPTRNTRLPQVGAQRNADGDAHEQNDRCSNGDVRTPHAPPGARGSRRSSRLRHAIRMQRDDVPPRAQPASRALERLLPLEAQAGNGFRQAFRKRCSREIFANMQWRGLQPLQERIRFLGRQLPVAMPRIPLARPLDDRSLHPGVRTAHGHAPLRPPVRLPRSICCLQYAMAWAMYFCTIGLETPRCSAISL